MKISLAAAVAALAILSAPAAAQEATLRFTTLAAPNFSGNVEVLHPWAKRINDQGAGVLKIEVIDGLSVANHSNSYDRLVNDVVQMAFVNTGQVVGKFNKISVVGLPFLTEKAETGSAALWRLYKSGMLDDEFDQAIPAILIAFPQTMPHYRDEPKSIDSFEGIKVVAIGPMPARIVGKLGGAAVTMPIFQAYAAMQRGVADAMISNFSAFEPYKFAEVTKVHVETNLGTSPGMYLVNRARYRALPEAARKILDANVTEKESREYGAYWDRGQRYGRQLVGDPAAHKVLKLPDATFAAWKQKLAPIEEEWVRDTPNGAAVLAKYKDVLRQVNAGM